MARGRRPRAGALHRAAVAAAVATASATASAAVAPAALATFRQAATAGATLSAATLAPPGGLSAGPCLLGSVTLTWTATPSTWADGYELRWGTSAGGPYPNTATSATTSTTVTGLSLLTTHRFVVRAYHGNWRSTSTAEVGVLC